MTGRNQVGRMVGERKALLRRMAEYLCPQCAQGVAMAADGFLGVSLVDHRDPRFKGAQRCRADQIRQAAQGLELVWWNEEGHTLDTLPVLSGPHGNSQVAAATISEGVSGMRARVLAHVMAWPGCTRDGISAGLQMKHQTTTARVTELLGLGYVEEVGQGKSDGGNPSALLEVTPAGQTAYHLFLEEHPEGAFQAP